MFILKEKRINIDAPYVSEDGIAYVNLRSPEVREQLGILEIPEPTAPEDFSDDLYYRTEQDDAPYVVYTRKSDEQLEQLRISKLQTQINALEAQTMLPRVAREFMLLSMEKEAVAAGFTLDDLRANHFAYRKVKELDEQIKALRDQL